MKTRALFDDQPVCAGGEITREFIASRIEIQKDTHLKIGRKGWASGKEIFYFFRIPVQRISLVSQLVCVERYFTEELGQTK